ncbi:hypothetical protein SBA4_280005 [Candidatus Sulfopaludibacter sp. SbA4]|nr:hypothetical protein SBA4_280005 [Candidatus Sulfopaludibacter sp. SbA4]
MQETVSIHGADGGAAFRRRAADHGHDLPDSTVPIGKEIDLMQLALDGPRQAAGVQAERDDEDLVEGHAPRAVERIADLGLKSAPLVHGILRKAGHKEVRRFDGAFDGARPVLAGQQLSQIHPGSESGGLERIVNPGCGRGILLDMGDEDLGQGMRFEAQAAGGIGMEGAQTVDLDGLAGGHAVEDDLRHQLFDGKGGFGGNGFRHGVFLLRARRRGVHPVRA